jgi:hypothetical protein
MPNGGEGAGTARVQEAGFRVQELRKDRKQLPAPEE